MMRAVWVPLCVKLCAGLAMSGAALSAADARAAGLTRAQVLADLADYQSVGYQFNDVEYPQNAIDATRKVVALRARRAADAANASKVAGSDAVRAERD